MEDRNMGLGEKIEVRGGGSGLGVRVMARVGMQRKKEGPPQAGGPSSRRRGRGVCRVKGKGRGKGVVDRRALLKQEGKGVWGGGDSARLRARARQG